MSTNKGTVNISYFDLPNGSSTLALFGATLNMNDGPVMEHVSSKFKHFRPLRPHLLPGLFDYFCFISIQTN